MTRYSAVSRRATPNSRTPIQSRKTAYAAMRAKSAGWSAAVRIPP
jgi:hypothetical protein